MLKVLLHLLQHLRGKRLIQVAGDVFPNMLALYNQGNFLRFGATFFN